MIDDHDEVYEGQPGYPAAIYAEITGAVTGLGDAAVQLSESILALVDHPFFRLDLPEGDRPKVNTPGSFMPIFNQAANDVIDLVHDCLSGRGRAAIRTARTLFELLVALRDVIASEEMDARYESHFLVGGVIFSRLRREAAALPGHEGVALRERLRQLGDRTQTNYEIAIDEYGRDFARDWAGRSILLRARDRGLEDDYEGFYRWASSEAHGTRAGMHGHWRGLGRDSPVYRIGPALSACPTALIHGLDYFDMVMESVESLIGDDEEVNGVRAAVSGLRALFPRFREAVLNIDHHMWPPALPANQVAMYGVGRFGSGGWYLHDRDRREVIRASPTGALPDGFLEAIRRLRDAHERMNVWSNNRWFPLGTSKMVVLAIPDVEVVSADRAVWQPEVWLLRRDVDGVGPHAEYLTAEIVSGTAEADLWSTGRGADARDPIAQALTRVRPHDGVSLDELEGETE